MCACICVYDNTYFPLCIRVCVHTYAHLLPLAHQTSFPVQPTSPPPPLTHGEKYNLFVNGNIYLQRVLFGRSNFATNGEVLAVVDDDAVSLGVVTCVFGKF